MAIQSIVTGIVTGAVERKTSKNGKEYRSFKIKTEGPMVRTFFFDEWLAVNEGDVIAVTGSLDFKVWQPEQGEPKVSLSIFANKGIKVDGSGK